MELWLWVIGVVVGFILFSGLFSRYRRDGEESKPLTDGAPPAGDNGSHDEGNPRPDLPPEDGHGHAVFSEHQAKWRLKPSTNQWLTTGGAVAAVGRPMR
jgi:hypothetical protein